MAEFVPARWICSLCGNGYASAGEAVSCEKRHMVSPKIVRMDYLRQCEYPRIIFVEFENGKRVEYLQNTYPTESSYDEDSEVE